jgi:hypothetical protein
LPNRLDKWGRAHVPPSAIYVRKVVYVDGLNIPPYFSGIQYAIDRGFKVKMRL